MSLIVDNIKIADACARLSLLGETIARLTEEAQLCVQILDGEALLAIDGDANFRRELQAVRGQGQNFVNNLLAAGNHAPDAKPIENVMRRALLGLSIPPAPAPAAEKSSAARAVVAAGGVS